MYVGDRGVRLSWDKCGPSQMNFREGVCMVRDEKARCRQYFPVAAKFVYVQNKGCENRKRG